jgi:hypothetical protein
MQKPQLIETQDGSQNDGQEVGKSTAPATTTHGSFARLRQRIQRNTLKYFRRDAAPH